MGLSPVKISDNRPDLFIDLAHQQGAIDEKVFSLNFAGDYSVSYLTIGGYDVEEFAVEDITWNDNLGNYFWAVSLEKIEFGGEEYIQTNRWGRQTATTPNVAIVDSGSSYILVPEKAFFDFFD